MLRRWFGFACIVLAAITLCLCFTGYVSRPDEVKTGTYAWDRLDLGLYRQTPNYADLLRAARSTARGNDEQKSIALLDLVSRRFAHGLSVESLLSSYPSYLAGFINPAFDVTFTPDRILSTGNLGFCSQQSYMLVRLANDLGIRARQVGLTGHVVAELWYANAWHMFDPDYEVFIRTADGHIASVRELALQPRLLEQAYGHRNPAVPGLYESRQDNNFVSYPIDAYFDWNSNALLHVTAAFQVIKWLIPALLLLIGLVLLRSGRRKSTRRAADGFRGV